MYFEKEEVRRPGRIGRRDGRTFWSPHRVLTRDRGDQHFLVTVTHGHGHNRRDCDRVTKILLIVLMPNLALAYMYKHYRDKIFNKHRFD
jgi:hypothetical protein